MLYLQETTILKINDRKIGLDQPPYIIAEVSANHNNDLNLAKKIIMEAKNCGASAVKLQTYTPDTLTLNSSDEDFCIKGGLWDGYTLYDLYKEASLPWEWHKPLFELAAEIDITIFSSPFDKTAIDFLEDLNCPAYKIASFEAIDLELIRYAAATKKPLIISTGMADQEEISEAIEAAREGGANEIAILHCVSSYPAPAKDYNLNTLKDMMPRFKLVAGLSDHTIENYTAFGAIAIGATIIEKHFTLSRDNGGPDDSFSLEPKDLKNLVDGSQIIWESMGKIDYGIKSSERSNIQFRRSLYFIKSLPADHIVTEEDIRCVRPGYGMAPKLYRGLIGQKLLKPTLENTPVTKDYFNNL
jgi:pseudaminic acid synthase